MSCNVSLDQINLLMPSVSVSKAQFVTVSNVSEPQKIPTSKKLPTVVIPALEEVHY